jgi:hypothetical protein
MPLAFIRKLLDVGQHLMRCQDDFWDIGSLPDVVGQGPRNLAISYGAPVEDPKQWIWPRLEFFPDRPVNQFPGRLENENHVSADAPRAMLIRAIVRACDDARALLRSRRTDALVAELEL